MSHNSYEKLRQYLQYSSNIKPLPSTIITKFLAEVDKHNKIALNNEDIPSYPPPEFSFDHDINKLPPPMNAEDDAELSNVEESLEEHDTKNSYEKYIIHKPESSYPQSIKNEIQLLSVSIDQPAVPFGSAIYRIQQYPGDVDLIEKIVECCDADKIYAKFIHAMKKVVRGIQNKKLHYYSEIKAGVDTRYDINVGRLENGHYYRGNLLIPQVNYLFKNNLIDDWDYVMIVKLQHDTSANAYDVIYNIIRKYYILRWTANEFLSEKKQVLGKKITLHDATFEKDTLFKIDEITLIQGHFSEVTNAYILFDHDPKQNTILHQILGNTNFGLIEGLQEEVEKLYYSDMFYNPFKVIKRMFAMSQSPKHNSNPGWDTLLEKLIPFISSTTSLLYQIKSELESILTIINKTKSYPKATINQQIDGMKFRLANFINIPQQELINLNNLIDSITGTDNKDFKLEHIEKLIKILKKYINYETITYMNSVNINPPPDFTMPVYHKYNRLLIRQPDSDPINPFDLLEKGTPVSAGISLPNPNAAVAHLILNKYKT